MDRMSDYIDNQLREQGRLQEEEEEDEEQEDNEDEEQEESSTNPSLMNIM